MIFMWNFQPQHAISMLMWVVIASSTLCMPIRWWTDSISMQHVVFHSIVYILHPMSFPCYPILNSNSNSTNWCLTSHHFMIGSVVNKYPCICLWLHCYQNSFLCLRKCIQCSTSTDCFTFVPCRGTHPSHIDHDRRDTPLNVTEGLDAGEVEIVFFTANMGILLLVFSLLRVANEAHLDWMPLLEGCTSSHPFLLAMEARDRWEGCSHKCYHHGHKIKHSSSIISNSFITAVLLPSPWICFLNFGACPS